MSQVGIGEEKMTDIPSRGWRMRISGIFTVGTLSERCSQWGFGEERTISYTQCWTLTDTCPRVEMGEQRRICTMCIVGDAQSHVPSGEW